MVYEYEERSIFLYLSEKQELRRGSIETTTSSICQNNAIFEVNLNTNKNISSFLLPLSTCSSYLFPNINYALPSRSVLT